MSEEEKIEQAISNLTRGNDIESAIYILERCALDGLIIRGYRVNIYKVAVRQILNFLDEYKNKGYLDVVREKTKANELVEKLQKELEEKTTILMAGADKVKQLEKENENLKELLELTRCDLYNSWSVEKGRKKENDKLQKELEDINNKWKTTIEDYKKELEETKKHLNSNCNKALMDFGIDLLNHILEGENK